MPNLSDKIENYLKQLLSKSSIIKVQRNDLAEKFNCVPSQINYVLDTRFSHERGYIIESQRGGGGYIKVIKVKSGSREELINKLYNRVGEHINQIKAINIVERLYEEEIITFSEKKLLHTIVHRKSLRLNLPQRDIVRAQLLKNILKSLIKERGG